MSDLTSYTPSSKVKPQRRISEAAAVYVAEEEVAMTTISTKNQITLPVHLLRELGLAPGDRLAITREGGRLVLRARPKDWVRYHGGSLAGVYGATREEIDAGIRELREDADRDEAIEGAWSGQEPGTQR